MVKNNFFKFYTKKNLDLKKIFLCYLLNESNFQKYRLQIYYYIYQKEIDGPEQPGKN